MGEIVAAAVVSHQPGIMLPEEARKAVTGGVDTTLVSGFADLRTALDEVQPDTFVIFDTHWFTTMQHVIAGADRYHGVYTSDELPFIVTDRPYDWPGAPELAALSAEVAQERGIALARVALLGSGGMSHAFPPMDDSPKYLAGLSPDLVITADHRAMDEKILDLWSRGDHAAVLDLYPEYVAYKPEGLFGHYLAMAGALGGREWAAKGRLMSEYESTLATGQVHVWFDL